jgi:hypothetical protein
MRRLAAATLRRRPAAVSRPKSSAEAAARMTMPAASSFLTTRRTTELLLGRIVDLTERGRQGGAQALGEGGGAGHGLDLKVQCIVANNVMGHIVDKLMWGVPGYG